MRASANGPGWLLGWVLVEGVLQAARVSSRSALARLCTPDNGHASRLSAVDGLLGDSRCQGRVRMQRRSLIDYLIGRLVAPFTAHAFATAADLGAPCQERATVAAAGAKSNLFIAGLGLVAHAEHHGRASPVCAFLCDMHRELESLNRLLRVCDAAIMSHTRP